nr:unnamed protein product [Callosobruchus chinensis]
MVRRKQVFVPVVIKRNRKNNSYYAKRINKNVKARSHKDSITTGLSIISNSYTDVSGFAPKKYVTECYLKPKTGPYWFSESVTLQTHSTKRRYNEKIYFMNRLHPCKWSERMTTKTNSQPTNVVSECEIYVEGVEPKEHTIHIPLQPVNGI